jgi:DNA-binding beta-propeller fold protein YncE/tRNA A-37 threonylcarbamoyl transferase component Bud32
LSDETQIGAGEDSGAVDADLHPGQDFAGHRIEAEIGRGGMGVVYRARNLALERERALKVVAPALSADAGFRERFRRESRLAAQVEHPNVVAVHDAGEERGRLYIAMRLVDGTDLRRLVEDQGPLEPGRAAAVIRDVAAGLDAAHERGLVHRDVKPSNVLVESDRGTERAFLTDFGISRSVGADTILTSAGAFLGSVDYVAPEQIEGEDVDGRVDVYALGAVAHFALTGLPPFQRDTDLAKLFAHANAAPPRPSDAAPALPPAIDEVVARAMAKRPAERYSSAGALAADLAKAVGGLPLAPAPPVPAPQASEATTRRLPTLPRRALAAGAAIAAAGIAAAIALSGGSSGGPAGFSGRVLATIGAGRSPNGLTVTSHDVWVASRGSRSITVIDPKSDRRTKPDVGLGGRPSSVAFGFGSVWATDSQSGKLYEIDPKSRTTIGSPIDVGAGPSDVAVSDRWIWVSNDTDGTVSRITPDPANRDVQTIQVGHEPRAIVAGAGAVWVTNLADGSVAKIDPSRAKTEGHPILTPGHPGDIAVGAGAVWAVDNYGGSLIKIDPTTGRIEDQIPVGAKPRGVKVGFGSVWVANAGDATVSRIDPDTGEQIGEPIPVGRDPADIAIGDGSVWTANYDDGTVTRIDPAP